MCLTAQALFLFFLAAGVGGQDPLQVPTIAPTSVAESQATEPQEADAAQGQSSEKSREEELLDQRRERLADLEPSSPSKVGQILATIENRGMETFTTVQIEHFRFGLGQLSPGSRLTPAVQYSRPNIGRTPLRFQISGAVSITGFQAYIAQFGMFEHSAPHNFLGDAFLGAPFHFDDRIQEPRDVFLYTDLMYRNFPRENYYGLSSDSLQEDRSDYSLKESKFDLVGGYQFTRYLAIEVRGGYQANEVGRGNDDRLPDTVDVFDEETAPGISEPAEFLHLDSALFLSWKGDPNRPVAEIGLRYAYYSQLDGDRFDFSRYSADARGHIPLGSRQRIFAFRIYTTGDLGKEGTTVPFYLMEWIGGSQTLRGFRTYRFRDTNLVYLSAEYRWEATAGLELAAFYDAGKAYPHRQEFSIRDLRSTYGLGLRVKNFRRVSFRLDAGWSEEGAMLYFAFGPSF